MLGEIKKVALGVAALSGAAAGGAAVAGAATPHSGTATMPAAQPPPSVRNMPAHGSAAHEGHEQTVTGEAAAKAQAAAVESTGGGTAGDVTTDYFGNGYEVTVTKSDGSNVEVHLDRSFDAVGPPGGGSGAPPGAFHK